MADFVHLHVHSDNSIQDGAVSVMALADRAEELGMEYLALTDHGNMFGAMEFINACRETIDPQGKLQSRKNPLRPILGCEMYVSPGSRFKKTGSEGENKYYHLVLLASNWEGYCNLVKLCSFAYTEGFYYRPRIDDELLNRYHGGLISLSACVSGQIPRLIQAGKIEEAEKKALFYRDLFGSDSQGYPNFYLEIQNHGIPAGSLRGTNFSEKEVYQAVIDISQRTGIPLAATNDIHYLRQEDAVAHDILLCIGQQKPRTEEKRKKYSGDTYYFTSAREMADLFPGQIQALENTVHIARRCTNEFIHINNKTRQLEYRFPKVDVEELAGYLPDFEIPADYENADSYLRHLSEIGLNRRYSGEKEQAEQVNAKIEAIAKWEEIQKRVQYELDVIIHMGFGAYYLIVADFINWAKDRGITVGPGRGSGAGSIVAYILRITDIDPLKYGLLFERFLNPERINMPDFDIDFCNERRDEVISYVSEKYGKERVAQIITFGTLRARGVIKDVARTLSISIPESEAISKLIPFGPDVTLASAFAEEPKLLELEADPRYTELFSLARKLEGLKRHCSIHAAGLVIGKGDLSDYVPLYRDPKTEIIATQYSMNFLEDCGLVKMDILGLKTLDLLHNAEKLIQRKGSDYADFSISAIDEHDQAVFAMLGEGRSFGIFQLESDGMQNVLRQAKPGKIEDLIAIVALYRPGPMSNIPQFIESKNGKRKITYPHPSLEEVLKETYGVIVYQEQVMQVARIIAGYSMGQADLLRRAMGKKKREIIKKEKINFIAGAARQGFTEAEAGVIYDILVPFGDYGFNKSHAAAYAILAYRTAYLKVHFPAEFMAAILSNEIKNPDKLSESINEARKMGFAIDPPNINKSDKIFIVAEESIVFGFLGIHGIGSGPADEIIEKRNDGPYTGFMDFLERVTLQTNQQNQNIVSRKVIELLIKTGAFDSFGINRPTLLENMESAIEYVQKRKNEGKFGQVNLFEDAGEQAFPDFELIPKPEMDRAEQLSIEKELIGFYFSGHPLDIYKEQWKQYVTLDLSDQDNIIPGNYTLIGILKSIKSHTDKTGRIMAFGSLEDYRGEIDLAFFGEIWAAYREKIKEEDIIAVRGRIDQRRGKFSLQVNAALNSAELKEGKIPELSAKPVNQYTGNIEALDKYKEVWEQNTGLDLSSITSNSQNELNNQKNTQKNTIGESCVLVGILNSLRTHIIKNTQKEMAFGTLEDYRGNLDLVFFERCWELNKDKLIENTCIAVKGKLDLSRSKPCFQVSSLLDLGKMRRAVKNTTQVSQNIPDRQTNGVIAAETAVLQEVHIRLHNSAAQNEQELLPLRDFLIDNPGPAPVFIHIQTKIIQAAVNITLNNEQLAVLQNNPIVAEVWVA